MKIEKVICGTPEEFHAEVEKHNKAGHRPVIRGRSLYVYGEVVAELVTQSKGRKPFKA